MTIENALITIAPSWKPLAQKRAPPIAMSDQNAITPMRALISITINAGI
jgi:hypothetical protein